MVPVASPVFIQAIANVLVEELNFPVDTVFNILERFKAQNCENLRIKNWHALKDWLQQSGAKSLWNSHFSEARAKFISDWIMPYIEGQKVLDLLCGDAGIGKHLCHSLDVYFSERGSHYDSDRGPYSSKFMDYENFEAKGLYDTVLLITVLHHEPNPLTLIEKAIAVNKKRIIVIENCIHELFDMGYQNTIDLFFNQCLNETNLPNPGSNLTAGEWVDIFANYNYELVERQYKSRIPGIPMPHDLLVFDKKCK